MSGAAIKILLSLFISCNQLMFAKLYFRKLLNWCSKTYLHPSSVQPGLKDYAKKLIAMGKCGASVQIEFRAGGKVAPLMEGGDGLTNELAQFCALVECAGTEASPIPAVEMEDATFRRDHSASDRFCAVPNCRNPSLQQT